MQMQIYHSKDCRRSSPNPDCTCGADQAQEELDRLQEIVEAIQRLIDSAETIVIQSNGRVPYRPKMVNASDLEEVLSGRLR
jgi:predicted metallo-beta-lactamase superfamily hydrolase